MRRLSSILILIFFIGCVGSNQPDPLDYPSWYLNPPINNGSHLYGVGEGKDINEAKASALSAVAASLSVTISSEFKKNESSSSFNGKENAYRSAINTVKSEIKKIEFNDFQIIQNQVISDKILVLVEVSRIKLFYTQKEQLQRVSDELKREEANILSYSPLKQAYLYTQSINKSQKLQSLALLCKTVNPDFNTQPYFDQASGIKQKQEVILATAKVAVSGAKIYIDALKEGLNKAGIKTVSSGANAHIRLKNSFQTDDIYGFKIAKATLSLSTLDEKNRTIATQTITLNGKSRYDYEKAQQNTVQAFSKKIETDGIFAILGIQ